MLWTLSDQGHISSKFSHLTAKGIPLFAIFFSMLGAGASLLSSVLSPDTVYLALVSISGLAVVLVWISISVSQICFRKNFIGSGGRVGDLKYKVKAFPIVPVISIVLCILACIGIAFDPSQRVALYFGIPFVAFCYFIFWMKNKSSNYQEQKQGL